MEYRELEKNEYTAALDLAYQVFLVYEAPDYPEDGKKSFYDSIHNSEYVAQLRIYGAFDGEKLVGIIATRSGGSHIALFFVLGEYHKKGIGRKLFSFVLNNCTAEKITVNSSPYAVEIYSHLGFTPTMEEQLTDGIRYTPMVCNVKNENCICQRIKCKRHGDCIACREYHYSQKRKPLPWCERTEKNAASEIDISDNASAKRVRKRR